MKLWRQKNRDYVNAYRRRYSKVRRALDPVFKLRNNMGSRIHAALKGNYKVGRSEWLIGCSWADLRKHLESLFRVGMSWENYGEWHVDHIEPCANFDLSSPIQQQKCFNFSNLQPLWAEENERKNKYVPRG